MSSESERDAKTDAAFVRAGELASAGDIAHARAEYEAIANSGHSELATAAHLKLGKLSHEHGDANAAKTSYKRAMISGIPEVAAMAAVNLSQLLEDLQDED